jgi:hypothetical protein
MLIIGELPGNGLGALALQLIAETSYGPGRVPQRFTST